MTNIAQSVADSDSLHSANVRKNPHIKALSVSNINLHQPGRQRVGHLLTLFGVSRSGFYLGLGSKYPLADGYDGKRPYWKNETILKALSQ